MHLSSTGSELEPFGALHLRRSFPPRIAFAPRLAKCWALRSAFAVGLIATLVAAQPLAAQTLQFTIGEPSDREQLYLEYINRSRADALAEASRLAQESDPDVVQSLAFFGVTPQNIESQFQWYVAQQHIPQHAQPLSFHEKLQEAARLHTQDMFDNEVQGHNSSSNPPGPFPPNASFGQRLSAVGYSFSAAGENVFAYADSVAHGHAGFDIDWGNVTGVGPAYNPAFVGQGMQNPAGHRLNLHNGDYNEIGIGVIQGTNGSVGPQLVTQDLGARGAVYVTGVVYEDLNGNAFYDLGEGRSGVRVDVDGSAYYAVSSNSGGYSVPIVGNGSFNVSFSGGNFDNYAVVAQVVDGMNVKVDYRVTSTPSYAANFDGDRDVDGDDLMEWQSALVTSATADADDDGDSDGADFLFWQREFGSGLGQIVAAVPEPATFCLVSLSAIAALCRRRRTR